MLSFRNPGTKINKCFVDFMKIKYVCHSSAVVCLLYTVTVAETILLHAYFYSRHLFLVKIYLERA